MKELLLSPVILTMVLAIVMIYVAIGFQCINKDKKNAEIFEKIALGVFLIAICEVTILPFKKLTPLILADREVTLPTVIGQLGLYGISLFCLLSRLRYTLKNFGYTLFIFLIKSPFLFLFFLLVIFSAFWSNDFNHSLKRSVVYLVTAAIAMYVGKQYCWKQFYSLIRWISFVILILSMFYANAMPSVGIHKSGSWQGILKHKNPFSFFMALTLVLWLIYGIYYPKQRKFAFSISILAMVAMDRGGSGASKVLFICLIGLMLYLNVLKKMTPQWSFVSVVVFFIISISLMIVVIENLEYIVVDTLNKDLTLTGRTLFWPLVIDEINKQPILGYGVAGFWQSWRGLDNPAKDIITPGSGFHPPHSHNGFLDIATDLGWLGMSIYIISFINTLAKSVIYLSQEKMPEAGLPLILLTFILMTNITETGLLGVNLTWFLYVLISVRTNLDTS